MQWHVRLLSDDERGMRAASANSLFWELGRPKLCSVDDAHISVAVIVAGATYMAPAIQVQHQQHFVLAVILMQLSRLGPPL
jgi:hypothetical protein